MSVESRLFSGGRGFVGVAHWIGLQHWVVVLSGPVPLEDLGHWMDAGDGQEG